MRFMKKHRLMRIAASALTVSAVAASMTSAAAAQSIGASQSIAASFCSGTGAIPAAALTRAASLSNCPIQGRLVVRSAGNAQIGVYVPPAGRAEVAVAVTTSGDYVLAVTNEGGRVTAATSFPATPAKAQGLPLTTGAAAKDPACTQLAVAYEGFVWNKTLKWYYNQSTVSRAGLNGPASLAAIRGANTAMTQGINHCEWSEKGFGSYIGGVPLGTYKGTTSKFANINSAGDCTKQFPDGQNTISWGPFNKAEAGTLAVTCFEYDTGGNRFAIEADTYLGSNRGIVTSFSPLCRDKYDLETVSAHEWGHAYGLAHHTGGVNEVMYEFVHPCATRRTLGEGDYEGMANLYGVKR